MGADLVDVQTNYYYEGILNWDHSQNISLTDTFTNWHTYEYDWQEDYISWIVDGQVGRTLYKNSTYNATSGQYMYPQTPSRLQISLWPGGLASNPIGTIEWAGGEIDWNSQDIQDYGYDYAIVQSVGIECNPTPPGASIIGNGSKSYRYVNRNATAASVVITDDDTILANLGDNGLDMTSGASSATSTSSSSSSDSSSSTMSSSTSSSVPDVPGGVGGANDERTASTAASTTAASSTTNAGGSVATASPSVTAATSTGANNGNQDTSATTNGAARYKVTGILLLLSFFSSLLLF